MMHSVPDLRLMTRVARLYERAGLTDFLAIMNFGGLPHARVLRSMELMAEHVLPNFPR